MSFYTIFDVAEVVASTTTTAGLMSPNDPILIHSTALKHKAQSTIGAVTTLWGVTSVATTTGPISSAGVFVLPSTGVGDTFTWGLADPSQKGQNVFFYNTTTTSTALTLTPISATISGSESTNGTATSFVFRGGPGSVELMALSTAAWLVVSRTGSGLCT